jgi:hypothetical protein
MSPSKEENAKMTLIESDERLFAVLRSVEKIANTIPKLQNCTLRVKVLDSFSTGGAKAFKETPSRYSKSGQEIEVNASVFFSESEQNQEVFLLHEIAHHFLNVIDPNFNKSYLMLPEEIIADLLVCRWGLDKSLIAQRIIDYGSEYGNALKLWGNQTQFTNAMIPIYQRMIDKKSNRTGNNFGGVS